MLFAARAATVKACAEIGTSRSFSERARAVTTTSASDGEEPPVDETGGTACAVVWARAASSKPPQSASPAATAVVVKSLFRVTLAPLFNIHQVRDKAARHGIFFPALPD